MAFLSKTLITHRIIDVIAENSPAILSDIRKELPGVSDEDINLILVTLLNHNIIRKMFPPGELMCFDFKDDENAARKFADIFIWTGGKSVKTSMKQKTKPESKTKTKDESEHLKKNFDTQRAELMRVKEENNDLKQTLNELRSVLEAPQMEDIILYAKVAAEYKAKYLDIQKVNLDVMEFYFEIESWLFQIKSIFGRNYKVHIFKDNINLIFTIKARSKDDITDALMAFNKLEHYNFTIL